MLSIHVNPLSPNKSCVSLDLLSPQIQRDFPADIVRNTNLLTYLLSYLLEIIFMNPRKIINHKNTFLHKCIYVGTRINTNI